jgi:hypothetical protein
VNGSGGVLLAVPDEAMLERDYGLSSESVAVMRALADIVAPAVDGCPAASEMGAHLRAAQSLEMLQRGSITLLTRLLNMYARAERRDASFLDLDSAERERALRALAEEDLDEMRDLVQSVHAFILGAYLAGFSAADPWQRPKVWEAMGFHGPARGHLPEDGLSAGGNNA